MSYPNGQRFGSFIGEGEFDTSESIPSSPVLQGRVEYNQPESGGFWHKTVDILKDVGRGIKASLPYLAQAAEGFASSPSFYLPSGNPLLPLNNGMFHQQHGVVYHPPSQNSGLGIQTYLKAQTARQSADFIRDTNPEPVQKAQATRRTPQPSEEPRFQSADEIFAEVLRSMPIRRLPKAEYQNRDEDRKQDLWPKIQAGQVLNDNKMKQLFLTLDIQHYQAQTKKKMLESLLIHHYADQKLAKFWSAKPNGMRTVTC